MASCVCALSSLGAGIAAGCRCCCVRVLELVLDGPNGLVEMLRSVQLHLKLRDSLASAFMRPSFVQVGWAHQPDEDHTGQ